MSTDPLPLGRAPLADPEETGTPHNPKCQALGRFLAPEPLVDILHRDLSNGDSDAGTARSIYAREVFRSTAASDDPSAVDAVPEGGARGGAGCVIVATCSDASGWGRPP